MNLDRELAYNCVRGCSSSHAPGVCPECAGTLWGHVRWQRALRERDTLLIQAYVRIAELKATIARLEEPR